MGLFSAPPSPSRRPRRGPHQETLAPNPSIAAAVQWLRDQPDMGGCPDSCVIIARKELRLPQETRLTLCRYHYRERGVVGRVVIGPIVWSCSEIASPDLDNDRYCIAYCGWHFLSTGLANRSITASAVNRPINVPDHASASTTVEYCIGTIVIQCFLGVNNLGELVAGATDGYRIISLRTITNDSTTPVYLLLGDILNQTAVY